MEADGTVRRIDVTSLQDIVFERIERTDGVLEEINFRASGARQTVTYTDEQLDGNAKPWTTVVASYDETDRQTGRITTWGRWKRDDDDALRGRSHRP